MTKKVLLVEDDRWLAESMIETLTMHDIQAVHAVTAQQAADILDKDDEVAAVVLDIMLPGANGVQLLNDMASYGNTKSLPVVLCTGSAKQIDPDDAVAYGVVSILDKANLTPTRLLVAVKGALGT